MRSTVFGSKVIFQPLGAEPESSTSSAGAVPVLVMTTGTEVCCPADARVDTRPSRPLTSSLGWPVIVEAEIGGRRSVLRSHSRGDLVVAGRGRIRRRDFELHVLALAGVDRHRVELLRAVLLGERGVEILRRLRRQAHRQLLAAVVLDAELIFEARLRGAAQFGKLRRDAKASPAGPWPASPRSAAANSSSFRSRRR